MRITSPRGLAFLLCLAFAATAVAAAADKLSRYVGTYELVAGKNLRVSVDGSDLKAQADGQPVTTLKPERPPGRFSVVGLPFIVQFLEDKAGVVTAVELLAPNGQKRRFRRLVDVHDAVAAAPLHALEASTDTSVNARVFNGYERKPGPDGSYPVETYAVANGGFIDYYGAVDSSLDHQSFKDIVQTVAPALARQNYLPGANPATTKLLLMIYWGATGGKYTPAANIPAPPDVRERLLETINRQNARTLGYEPALEAYAQRDGTLALFSTRAKDLMDELEERRYWVALCAFDYQTARTDKKLKLLWTVRYNLPSVGTNFNLALPQMTDVASRYFGRDSGGLINRPDQDKRAWVELGETKVLGTEK